MRKIRGSPCTLFSFQDILTSVIGIFLLVALLMMLQLVQELPATSDISIQEAKKREKEIEQISQECRDLEALIGSLRQNSLEAAIGPETLQKKYAQLQEEYETLQNECTSLKNTQEMLDRQIHQAENALQDSPQRKALKDLETKINIITAELAQLQSEHILIFRPSQGSKRPWLVDLARKQWSVFSPETFHMVACFDGDSRMAQLLEWAKQRLHPDKDYFVFFVRPSMIDDFLILRKKITSGGFRFDIGFDPVGESQALHFRK